MKLLRINGGFGNQMFQYIFLRYLELEQNENIIVDDTPFFIPNTDLQTFSDHNIYLIDRIFDNTAKRLSNIMDRDVFKYLVDTSSIPDRPGANSQGIIKPFEESGIKLFTVQEGRLYQQEHTEIQNYYSTPVNSYDANISDFHGDIYYYGYWINPGYFEKYSGILLKEFTFPEITDDNNKYYLNSIIDANEHSIAFHIRRGDFVKIGWAVDASVYASMITKIRESVSDPVFFIFSDDIPWVKAHYSELGLTSSDTLIYIEGNNVNTSYIEVQLMTKCRGMVFSNSSFSYLASLLNTRKDKVVVQCSKRRILFYN